MALGFEFLHGIDGVDAASSRIFDKRQDAASTCPGSPKLGHPPVAFDVCFEDAWGPSMGLRRTGLGLRSHWRLCLRGTAKGFVRLRCCYSPKVWAGVDPECGDFAGDERAATIAERRKLERHRCASESHAIARALASHRAAGFLQAE